MLLTFGIAICLFLTTTVIHAEAMLFVMRRIRTVSKRELQGVYRSRIYKVGAIVIVMFLASVAEVFVWALTYIALNAIEGLERAMYFSMVKSSISCPLPLSMIFGFKSFSMITSGLSNILLGPL